MGLLAWLVTGVLVAVVMKVLFPARSGVFAVAIVTTTAGALIGGYICTAFNMGTLATLDLRALLAAFAGSLLFLFLFRKLRIN
ncbi:hypothetical protein [Buttiauxella sp. A111]|uniref:hypothetical protein n=1 Tax=Buttiauxella sp. A111 TaxID=2563088 RepID=UPI00161E033D|nr:hypothetical protein [Buttiauxella sp. A111]